MNFAQYFIARPISTVLLTLSLLASSATPRCR